VATGISKDGLALSRTDRPSVLRYVIATLAWASSMALCANALLDLAIAPPPRFGNPLVVALSDLNRALTEAALPALALTAFALALIATWFLLRERDHSTLRWLRQGWVATLVSYVGGITMLPRGSLLIYLLLLCGSMEGVRVVAFAFARRFSESSVLNSRGHR